MKKTSLWQKLLKKVKKGAKKPTSQEEDLGDVGEIPRRLKVSNQLQKNLQQLKNLLGDSPDIKLRQFKVGKESLDAAVFWVDNLTNEKMIGDNIIKALTGTQDVEMSGGVTDLVKKLEQRHLNMGDVRQTKELADSVYAGLSGNTVIFIDGFDEAIVASTISMETRGIEEPASELVVRGPREGFTESLGLNISLVRRRLKNPNLRIEGLKIGRQTQTNVALLYVKDIVNPKVLEEMHSRLKRIETDAILESAYIEEMIEDAPFSIFPTVTNTERPDTVVAGLLEGRIVLLVDGTPFGLLAPTIFFQLFQTPEDYYNRYPLATFSRWLRLFGLGITLLLPSLYIATTTFHPEVIPAPLLLTIAASRQGIPFPAFVEALLMEVTFEVLREAAIRMPRPVGQAVSIVGALVLGDAAISAGIVSPAMVVIVATTAISSFLIPSSDVVGSIRMLRFGMMILAASMGYYGIMIGLIALHIHMVSLRSFGVPYMWPIAPFNLVGLRDVLMRIPHWGYHYRPEILTWKEEERMKAGQNMPRKPKRSPLNRQKSD